MIRRRRLPEDVEARLGALAEHFRRDARVLAVYLFGSFARGEAGPLSDVDIAVLLRHEAFPAEQLEQLTDDYLAQINRVLATDEVSFVLLNRAPLTLRCEIVRTGKVLVDNDPAARLEFEVHTEDLYMDFKPLVDAYDEALLRQLSTSNQ